MKRYHILLILLAASLTVSACVKLGGKPLDKKYYQITPVRTAAPVTQGNDFVLKVRRLSISDLYNTRELVYRHTDGRIESDFYNMYFVPPSNMLTTELKNGSAPPRFFRTSLNRAAWWFPG